MLLVGRSQDRCLSFPVYADSGDACTVIEYNIKYNRCIKFDKCGF